MAQESPLSPSGFPRWSAITLTLVIDVVVALAPSDKFPNRVKHIPMRVLKSGETAGVLECGEGAAMAKRTPEQEVSYALMWNVARSDLGRGSGHAGRDSPRSGPHRAGGGPPPA